MGRSTRSTESIINASTLVSFSSLFCFCIEVNGTTETDGLSNRKSKIIRYTSDVRFDVWKCSCLLFTYFECTTYTSAHSMMGNYSCKCVFVSVCIVQVLFNLLICSVVLVVVAMCTICSERAPNGVHQSILNVVMGCKILMKFSLFIDSSLLRINELTATNWVANTIFALCTRSSRRQVEEMCNKNLVKIR